MFVGLRGVGGIQGGVETHVAELIRHLPMAPDRLEVIAREPYRRRDLPADPDLPMIRWLPASRYVAFEAVAHTLLGVFYAALRRPAVLHVHGIGPGVAIPLARLLGLCVVATHHGFDYEREKWGGVARGVLRWGERQAMSWANACICISPVASVLLRAAHAREITFIHNGVADFAPVTAGATLEQHGLVPGRYIVNVARMVPEKRQLDLIAAFHAADLPSDVRLVLIGGADHESGYARRVRQSACPRVILTGHVSGTPLAELFSNAGLFVLPSSHEGLPISLLEAMAYDRQLLLSDLPVYRAMGLPEDRLFPVGDVAELARRLEQIFETTPDRHDWSEMLVPYRWPSIALRTAQVYRQCAPKEFAEFDW